LDAQVIGVSTDSLDTNIRFAQENGIEYPLISDTGKAIKKAYGRGRVTYLIDKTGVIRMVKSGVPDNQQFIEKLRELQ
jgi:peroxiredoxin Q/BCP